MNENEKKLMEKYIKASEDFYNGLPVKISDKQYDELEQMVKEFMPDFDVKQYIVYHQQGITLKHHAHFIPYTKSSDSKLDFNTLFSFGDIISPKYDGCSIVAYYRNGKCYQIISRSDDKNGKNQYDKLINKFNILFPDLDPTITEVFCEAVVNRSHGDRSKANGLINSKYMQAEVDQILEIKPCECYSPDPKVRRSFCDRYVYQIGKEEMDLIIRTGFTSDGTPADGVVAYNPKEYKLKMRKVYANGSAITTIRKHEMTFSEKTMTQAAVCNYDKVFVDGANLSNVKMGPINKLKKMGLGIGAEVEIIRVKKIIPYVNKVLTKSNDFSDIKCKFCGKSMQVVGKDLMCTDLDCFGMNKHMFRRIASVTMKENPEALIINQGYKDGIFLAGIKNYIDKEGLGKDIADRIKNLDAEGVFKLFKIPRFDLKKKFKDIKKLNEQVKEKKYLNEKLTYFYPKCSTLQKNLIRLLLDRINYILNKLGIELN